MGTVFTSFRDLAIKALPTSKRGSTMLDFTQTAVSSVREFNEVFYTAALDFDFFAKHSVQAKTLPSFLNDLYDPVNRNISISQDNDPASLNHFTINFPTYLAFGNYEEVIRTALSRYLYVGILYDFNTFNAGTTEASIYLTELESNLAAGDYLTDTEIWAVQFLYSALAGADVLQYVNRLHLISPTNKTNSLIDFIDPTGTTMTEVAGAGGITHSEKGLKGDNVAYINTNWNATAEISDVDNWITALYISEDGAGTDGSVDVGVTDNATSPQSFAYLIAKNPAPNGQSHRGGTLDSRTYSTSTPVGSHIQYTDQGDHGVLKDGVQVLEEVAIDGSSVLPNKQTYLLAENANGTAANFSVNTVATWGEIDNELSGQLRIFVSDVITEYNNRLKR